MRILLFCLRLTLLIAVLSVPAVAPAFADEPSGTSTDRPKSNAAIEELDRKERPAEVRAISAPQGPVIPGEGSGSLTQGSGSSMGLGISIPLNRPREAAPSSEKSRDQQ
jgi:hypothetical protein